jgi:hypothetical protein
MKMTELGGAQAVIEAEERVVAAAAVFRQQVEPLARAKLD